MRKVLKNSKFIIPAKFHVKSGDLVEVISGDDKGKRGNVIKILRAQYRAVVKNINLVTKHLKPSAEHSRVGSKITVEAPIHLSKLMLVDANTGEKTRIGRKMNENNKLARYSKKTGKFL